MAPSGGEEEKAGQTRLGELVPATSHRMSGSSASVNRRQKCAHKNYNGDALRKLFSFRQSHAWREIPGYGYREEAGEARGADASSGVAQGVAVVKSRGSAGTRSTGRRVTCSKDQKRTA